MIRFWWVLLPWLIFAQDIDNNIQTKQAELERKTDEKQKINKQISTLGDEVVKLGKEIETVTHEVKQLSGVIEESKEEYRKKSEELKSLKVSRGDLIKARRGVEQDIVNVLAKELSFYFVLHDIQPRSVDDLVRFEAFEALSTISKQSIQDLKQSHKQLSHEIVQLNREIGEIERFTKKMEQKKAKLDGVSKKKSRLVRSLEDKKSSYLKRLKAIAQEQEELRKLLKKLKIVKQEQEKAEALAAAKKKENQKTKQPSTTTTVATKQPELSDEELDVRRIGSSYHNVKTVKYKGRKTISPLDSFSIIKQFGPYYDPVYKIKVFNESVTLRSNASGAKVKNILDGKVVFAKETPMLQKVVIVEHPGNLHTIYAHLDKIAPTIRQGLKVKKGYVIGRVNENLMLEVTKKNYHINPMELIAMR